jgi:hypothetical protein
MAGRDIVPKNIPMPMLAPKSNAFVIFMMLCN